MAINHTNKKVHINTQYLVTLIFYKFLTFNVSIHDNNLGNPQNNDDQNSFNQKQL